MPHDIELTPNSNFEQNKIENKNDYKIYRRRWLILFLYTLFSISICMHIIEFSIIAHIITEYYNVSYEAVDWTTMVASVVYILMSIPVTYVIDKIGIRKSIIIGVIGNCLGAWIKVGSVHPDRFWLVLLGQGIISLFKISIYPILPKLAATWFGYGQISLACGLGMLGIQVGTSLSFLLPPLIVYNGEVEEVEKRLYTINIAYATFATILVPLIIILFTDSPPTPPSIAQEHIINKKQSNTDKGLYETFKTILFIKPYMLFLIIFGINMGILGPIQVLSNQIILSYYSNADHDVGIIGLLQTMLGSLGSMGTAVVLDKYKNYKITCWLTYFLFFASLIFYIGTIDQGLEFVYISSIIIGIGAGAIMTLGFGLVVEFTYPEAESISMGLAIHWMTVISLIFTLLSGHMLRSFGFITAGLTMVAIIFASDLLFFFIKFDLRRKAIQNSQNKSEVSPNL